jgi:hypothetical protein
MRPSRERWLTGFVLAAWLGVVASGFACWERYDATPGDSTPAGASAHSAAGRWELVLFLHPHCPCSRASLQELRELAEQAPRELVVRVSFVRPGPANEGWENSPLWKTARAIPGAQVGCDLGGIEARAAGAATSGHFVLYDPAGRVAFSGGLTRARGREGESASHQAVLDLLAGREPAVRSAPVFGCALFSPEDTEN